MITASVLIPPVNERRNNTIATTIAANISGITFGRSRCGVSAKAMFIIDIPELWISRFGCASAKRAERARTNLGGLDELALLTSRATRSGC